MCALCRDVWSTAVESRGFSGCGEEERRGGSGRGERKEDAKFRPLERDIRGTSLNERVEPIGQVRAKQVRKGLKNVKEKSRGRRRKKKRRRRRKRRRMRREPRPFHAHLQELGRFCFKMFIFVLIQLRERYRAADLGLKDFCILLKIKNRNVRQDSSYKKDVIICGQKRRKKVTL